MIEKIESLKDTLQVAVESGAGRVERIHGLIVAYVRQTIQDARNEDVIDRKSIYDLIRAINREVGEAATDLIEMAESAQQRLRADAGRAERRPEAGRTAKGEEK